MRMNRSETVFSYNCTGPKRLRWAVADTTDPSQPLHGVVPVDEILRKDLEVLKKYGFLESLHRGYGCKSFWRIKESAQ